jgi:hypothetical protein
MVFAEGIHRLLQVVRYQELIAMNAPATSSSITGYQGRSPCLVSLGLGSADFRPKMAAPRSRSTDRRTAKLYGRRGQNVLHGRHGENQVLEPSISQGFDSPRLQTSPGLRTEATSGTPEFWVAKLATHCILAERRHPAGASIRGMARSGGSRHRVGREFIPSRLSSLPRAICKERQPCQAEQVLASRGRLE